MTSDVRSDKSKISIMNERMKTDWQLLVVAINLICAFVNTFFREIERKNTR